MLNSNLNIPMPIALYFLATHGKLSIDNAIVYLIKSVDGDSFYLTDERVEDNVISMELGEVVYESIVKCSYEEVFNWRNALIEAKKQEEELDA